VKKRVNTQAKCNEIIDEFRALVTNLNMFLAQYQGAAIDNYLDVEKSRALISSLSRETVNLPKRCFMIFHKAASLEYLQFQRTPEFISALRPSNGDALGLSPEDFHGNPVK
jgi:hypothetical protein